MSEVTPTELNEEFQMTVQDASVIPVPVDPTLSHQGEAADAYATGQAVAAATNGMSVNGKSFVNKAVTIYGTEIYVSDGESVSTVTQAIESANERTADDIIFDTTELTTVKDAIEGISQDVDEPITDDEIDEVIEDVFGGED